MDGLCDPSKGGPVCQYETNINTYLDTAKNIYKDLVAIKQNINGEKEIRSKVFQIELTKDGDGYVPGGKIKERFLTQILSPFRVPLAQHSFYESIKVPPSKCLFYNSRSFLPSYHCLVSSMGPN